MAAAAPLTDAEKARLAHEALRLAENDIRSKRQIDALAGMAVPAAMMADPDDPARVRIATGSPHSLANIALTVRASQDPEAPGVTDAEGFVEQVIAREVRDIYRVWEEATLANLAEHHPKDLAEAEKSWERDAKAFEERRQQMLETGAWPADPVFGHARGANLANALYDLAREAFLGADFGWDTVDARVALIDSADYTVNLGTHQFLSSVPAAAREEVTAAGLASKTLTAGVADAADLAPAFPAAAGDPCEALLLYDHTGGADTARRLIGYIDTATGLPVTLNGGDINVTWDNGANRIFKL